MAFKVAVTTGRPFDPQVFESRGIEYVQRDCKTEDEVIEAAKDADGLMVWITPLTTRRVIESLPKCRVISRHGVGVDSIDLDAATERGIMVCNLPNLNAVEVAEHAMSLLLSLIRQVVSLDRGVKQGLWRDNPGELFARQSKMFRIAGSTVGIIALGNIGRAFAVRAKGFGPARILAYDKYIHQVSADIFGVQMVDLDTLLRESDFISIHAPETPETYHMIDREALTKMKPSACVINTSRGGLIDDAALCEALESGTIAGAALDVTEDDPVSADNPLTKLDNVILTPHFAAYSEVTFQVGKTMWPENVAWVLEGGRPHGLANPKVIERIAVLREQGDPRWTGV
jgi:D-3-phosphoglycerate dehydrogenase